MITSPSKLNAIRRFVTLPYFLSSAQSSLSFSFQSTLSVSSSLFYFRNPHGNRKFRTQTSHLCSATENAAAVHNPPMNYNKNFFITTPIYYVNGLPHLGHAYTTVVSDVIARFHHMDGSNVFLLTGTDEHGQKVQQSAAAAGKTPQQFADDVSEQFRALSAALHCYPSTFLRTTETRHREAVQHLWQRLVERDQIYLGRYQGWYSVRDEAFYSETELVDGKAPTGAAVEWVEEESYFFRLSSWTERLLAFYDQHPDFISPRGRRNEVVSFVGQEGGLKDLSVSRTTFSWGIPVPNDPKHVVYVWLDALTNYITALGYPDLDSADYKAFWPADLHVVGKDILRFHAVFWPAFLMAADLPPPKRVFAHGWWTRDGEKMSKSVGNVVDPWELLRLYGNYGQGSNDKDDVYVPDYLRYFLVAEIAFGSDGDFSHAAFCARINSDLANDIGNLAQRVLTMITKNCAGQVPTPQDTLTAEDERVLRAIKQDLLPNIRINLNQQNLKGLVESIVEVAKMGNRYIDVQAPWHLLKTDKARMNTVLYVLFELIRVTSILLAPIVPTSSEKLLDLMGLPQGHLRSFQSIPMGQPDPDRIDLHDPNLTPPGLPLGGTPYPIFPKLEVDKKGSNKDTSATLTSSPSVPSPTYTPSPLLDSLETADLATLRMQIGQVGDRIREMKKQSKDTENRTAEGNALLKKTIGELTALKDRYKMLNNGVAYDPVTDKTR